jgi:hypothetical protein
MEGLIAAASEVTPARVATSAADIDSTRDRTPCAGAAGLLRRFEKAVPSGGCLEKPDNPGAFVCEQEYTEFTPWHLFVRFC